MRRYGWFLGIGAVLLCALAWIVVGKSLADDETKLGPPIVIPSATSSTEPQSEPTLEESHAPQPSSPATESADDDAAGAERIAPAPPRHAGDDDRDDDREDDDSDDDDADEDRDDDDHDDAYDEDDDDDGHDDAEDENEDEDDDDD